jgi:hypothetical protein
MKYFRDVYRNTVNSKNYIYIEAGAPAALLFLVKTARFSQLRYFNTLSILHL